MRTKDCNKEGSEGKRTDGPFFILELDEGTWKSPWTSHRKVGSQSPGDTNNTTYMVCLSGRDKLSACFLHVKTYHSIRASLSFVSGRNFAGAQCHIPTPFTLGFDDVSFQVFSLSLLPPLLCPLGPLIIM